MQDNVLGAASFGAANAHRLHGIANGIVQRIDDAEPLTEASMEAAKIVAALTKLGNDAALIPLGLLAANKERVINSDPDAKRKPLTINDFYGEDVA